MRDDGSICDVLLYLTIIFVSNISGIALADFTLRFSKAPRKAICRSSKILGNL